MLEQRRIITELTGINLTDADMEYLKDHAQKPYDLPQPYGANKGDNLIFFPEEGIIEMVVVIMLLEIARFLLRKGFE